METNKQKHFTLIYRNETRSIPIKADPSYNDVMNYAKNLFPVLQDISFKVGYTDDEDDFVSAKSDMELTEAYRLFKDSNEIRLTIQSDKQPLSPSGYPEQPQTYNSSPNSQQPQPKYPDASAPYPSENLQINDSPAPMIDDTLLQSSLDHLNQLMADVAKAKENLILFNEKYRAQQLESEKLITTERERYKYLDLELRQAKENFAASNLELANLKESLKKIGTQYQLKLREIAELKRDREEKLRLKTQLDDIDKHLHGRIEENLTMSKHLYTLTVERDHFTKKTKELEQKQKTMELEFTASQFANINLGNPFLVPVTNNDNNTPVTATGIPINPVPGNFNQGGPFTNSPGISLPLTIGPPTNLPKIPSSTGISPADAIKNLDLRPSPSPSSSVYDLANPPPDISKDDITMLISMGFKVDRPDQLFDLIRSHKGDISRVIEELLKKLK